MIMSALASPWGDRQRGAAASPTGPDRDPEIRANPTRSDCVNT